MGEFALENYSYEDYLAIDKTTKDEEDALYLECLDETVNVKDFFE